MSGRERLRRRTVYTARLVMVYKHVLLCLSTVPVRRGAVRRYWLWRIGMAVHMAGFSARQAVYVGEGN